MSFSVDIIFGPTASGKSALAHELAQKNNTDILSFDSRQVYTEMDIVTGKDIPAGYSWQDGVYRKTGSPTIFGHDLVFPDQEFSIRQYYEYAQGIIQDARKFEKLLVLVGGSWLYASVLLDPPASLFAPISTDRDRLTTLSVDDLQKELRAVDPQKYSDLNESDRQNPRRLIRAIEVTSFPSTEKPQPLLSPGEYRLVLQDRPFDQIERAIRQRIDERWSSGALEETQALVEKYPDWNFPSFSATGYKLLREHISGRTDESTTKELWYLQERQYAKRQMTWMRRIQRV